MADYWEVLYPEVIEVSRKIATAPGSNEERLRLATNNLGFCIGTAVSALVMIDPSLKGASFRAVAEQLLKEIVSELPADDVLKHIPTQH